MTFVLLNPNDGDSRNDPTVSRCAHFAARNGYGYVHMVNLFAWRSSSPKALPSSKDEAVGSMNDRYIREVVKSSTIVVCGWGVLGRLYKRSREVLEMIRNTHPAHALAETRGGFPAHPLYLPSTLLPNLYWKNP